MFVQPEVTWNRIGGIRVTAVMVKIACERVGSVSDVLFVANIYEIT
jgi:hypothetical protein